ncbi:hypothetical protein [Burkholderia ubonensis]|uniref:hypothetical protein n=1 Tax=Burkholderia ubonensis TaxID=101571 RepID=UPI000BA7CDC2|nr:hypothetical protein [Burkholderia ubonensis]PAJ88643.1 hypothetical protein CJO70_05730 [Burkholderia ubonensis]PAJ89659.1 hypothetical protein CJO69_33920 [Burkholderia ubonensis]PAK09253.1 hypothetical protein CJO67_04300 [Burkholderia ubonensis]RQP75361.1 hypothetical protein DF013_14380 [Burkholderia ubonensis]RQP83793.1 hypothetical protein DF014_15670 [Burkholderia ubonensis]
MTRFDLLSHLVTSQLAARIRTGRWLPPDVLVATMRTWLSYHRIEYDWLERVRIGAASVTLSHDIYDMATAHDDREDGGRSPANLDAPQLKALRARCEALLQHIHGDGEDAS